MGGLMRWAWFGLAVAVVVLGVAAGLYVAGPEQKVVTYTHTNAVKTEGYCEMTAEAEEAQQAAEDEFVRTGDPADFPPEPDEDCGYYAEYGAVWVPPVYERLPVTRVERTNAWERITRAVTGD
jgi:hypothetical protein